MADQYDKFIETLSDEEKKAIKEGRFEDLPNHIFEKGMRLDLAPKTIKPPKQTEIKPRPSTLMEKGLGFLATSAQGPTLGFSDEIYGGIRAGLSGDLKNYEKFRDQARISAKTFEDKYPKTAFGGQVIASLPFLALKPLQGMQATRAYMAANPLKTTATVGALGGATAGAGFSERDFDLSDPQFIGDIRSGALLGAGGNLGLGYLGRKAQPYIDKYISPYLQKPKSEAKGLLLQDLARDETPFSQIVEKMGPSSVLGVSGGPNLLSRFDSLVSQPGTTPARTQKLSNLVEKKRDVVLGDRIEKGILGNILSDTSVKDFKNTFIDNAQKSASPLYNIMKRQPIDATDTLKALMKKAEKIGAFTKAKQIADADPEDIKFTLDNKFDTLDFYSFTDVQKVKESLGEFIQDEIKDGKLSKLGQNYQALQKSLVKELDNQTILDKDTVINGIPYKAGDSLYSKARGLWSGMKSFENAFDEGKRIFGIGSTPKSLEATRELLENMPESEKKAFRLGAFDAIKNKLDFDVGVNEVLKASDIEKGGQKGVRKRFELLFPKDADDEFNKFIQTVNEQADLKKLSRLGGGSQTSKRTAKREDDLNLDNVVRLNQARQAMSGDFVSPVFDQMVMLGKKENILREPTRNLLGDMMLMNKEELQGLDIGDVLPNLDEEMRQKVINRLAATNALQFGLLQPTVQDF